MGVQVVSLPQGWGQVGPLVPHVPWATLHLLSDAAGSPVSASSPCTPCPPTGILMASPSPRGAICAVVVTVALLSRGCCGDDVS